MTSGKGKSDKRDQEVGKKDVFQAVLLADNFENYVLGKNCPYVPEWQIPVNNRKLIDYSLEALTASGVHEIFLYSTRNTNDLREYIKSSKWSDLQTTITIVSSEDSLTLGDALRDLDAKAMLRNDFILMQAGVITNIPLRPLLDKHRETEKTDKGAVMTLVHRKMSLNHRSRPKNSNAVVAVGSKTGKIISYNFKVSGKKLSIPLESIQPEMDLYLDTLDTGIAICSACVAPLFTDNFDFCNMNDFIKGILINEEIMGNSLYLVRLDAGYANRVVDFQTYTGISLDILQRWTYPLVPDMPFGGGDNSTYPFNYNFTYKGSSVKIEQGAEVCPLAIIGHKSVIGKSSSIVRSSLGDNCKIGQNVKIVNSVIGNNVTIEDDCEIHEDIITDGITIKKGTELKPWVLVEGKTQSRIELPAADEDDDDDSDSDSEEEVQNVGAGYESDEGAAQVGGLQDEDYIRFSTEVLESLQRGFEENVQTENLVLEINSSKYAYNISFKEVTTALIKGVLGLVAKLNPDRTLPAKVQLAKTKEMILKFKSLFEHYVKTEVSQTDVLNALEEYANDNEFFQPLLMQTLHCLYDEDILSEDVILAWHSNESLYAAGKKLRTLVQTFVDWLENAESEEDSS